MPRSLPSLLSRRELLAVPALAACTPAARKPLNLLFAISDDQSWLHTSAAGDRGVKTPSFDRVARAGVRFTQAICSSPGCAPSRAAILTGRHPWQLEEAGTHASLFPRKHVVYPDLLTQAGYHVGLTGKGAGPANFEASGWPGNPAGKAFNQRKAEVPQGINNNDYASNFNDFLDQRPQGQPFAFWFGCHEPHRAYMKGIGLKSGKRLADAHRPPVGPETPEIRRLSLQ